ncbi:hypothetical protein B0H14DRAFT_3497872 [Mycena olivaceomarginata]|nr:hypothetical protein B0H14DRAFT_3497872 [Mycena olivaceomarginata]
MGRQSLLPPRHARKWWVWLVFIALVALSVSQVPLTVAYCVFSINRANIFISTNLRIKRATLIAAAVVDFTNAGAMIVLLKDTDPADGRMYWSKTTARTIRRLTLVTINTGLITAVVAIISLVLDETASGTVFWTSIAQYPQCSIYLSVFLANLNARGYIRGAGDGVTISNIEDIRFAAATAARGDAEASKSSDSDMGSGETSSGAEGQETAAYESVAEKASH